MSVSPSPRPPTLAMNFTTLACATLLFAGSTSQPTCASAEAVTLAWKLSAGADYLVKSSSTVESLTVTVGQEQEESTKIETTHRVHVKDVTEDGNMELTITVDAYFMSKESEQLSIELTGERDEDGGVHVVAEIDSPVAELLGDDVVELFEAIGRNNMDLEFTVILMPTGEVESCSLKGDPMQDLPTDSQVTEMIAATASALLDAEDLPGMLASQVFSLLPPEPVEVEAKWDVSRHFSAIGLEMDGKGSCSLDEVLEEGDVRIAVLTENMEYNLGTEGLEENMLDMMDLMFERAGVEMDVDVELDADHIEYTIETRFDIESGFNRSMKWSDMITTVNGVMTIQGSEMEMEVETVSSGHSSWSRVEPE